MHHQANMHIAHHIISKYNSTRKKWRRKKTKWIERIKCIYGELHATVAPLLCYHTVLFQVTYDTVLHFWISKHTHIAHSRIEPSLVELIERENGLISTIIIYCTIRMEISFTCLCCDLFPLFQFLLQINWPTWSSVHCAVGAIKPIDTHTWIVYIAI